MSDWRFVHYEPAEEFARVEYYSLKRDGVEFRITVREYATPPDPAMKFFATSDLQTNQRTAPFTPCGWGPTVLTALAECMRAIRRFPYEGDVKAT
jgi:hypothetical protein